MDCNYEGNRSRNPGSCVCLYVGMLGVFLISLSLPQARNDLEMLLTGQECMSQSRSLCLVLLFVYRAKNTKLRDQVKINRNH